MKKEETIEAVLIAAAQLLDDCLIRIYPEEFTKEQISGACDRFKNGGGTIARIAKMSDKLRDISTLKTILRNARER